MVAVMTLALMPASSGTSHVLLLPALNHIIAFTIITGLLRISWKNATFSQILIAAFVFGGVIEILQWTITSDREMSFGDVILNIAGSLIGCVSATILKKHYVN